MQTSNFSVLGYSVLALIFVAGCRTGGAQAEAAPLKFGVFVKFFDLGEAEAKPVAKAFEARAQSYKACSISGQEFNFRFSFEVSKNGLLSTPKMISQTPDRQGFLECFLKNFGSLRLPASKKAYRGEAQIGAYRGENPAWLSGFEQKILEK